MKIAILTGAGISAESGLQTFRDHNGLWYNFKIEEVATVQAIKNNLPKVNEFYNMRRKDLLKVEPNAAHLALAKLDQFHDVTIITQNVDDLHERAGSKKILHIHGELKKVRHLETDEIIHTTDDVDVLSPVRPHVCLFGEFPYYYHETMAALFDCKLFIAIGTSGNVSPASGFIDKINKVVKVPSIEVNIKNTEISHKFSRLIRGSATESVVKLVEELINV